MEMMGYHFVHRFQAATFHHGDQEVAAFDGMELGDGAVALVARASNDDGQEQ
jgi:hypothetical protein